MIFKSSGETRSSIGFFGELNSKNRQCLLDERNLTNIIRSNGILIESLINTIPKRSISNQCIKWRLFKMATKEEIIHSLDQIRPFLQRDGGDVEFVDYNDGILKVRLTGACRGCPYSQMTLASGIKQRLQQEFPDLKEVVNI